MRNAGRVVCLLVLPLLFLHTAGESYAGFERRYIGVRSLATAGALCAFGEDPWSFYFNPAHAARIRELSLFYVPSMMGLQEIKATGISYRDNLWGLDLGGGIQTFGFELYRENVFTLNLSAPLYDYLFLGCNMNFNHLFIKDYGTDVAVSLDAGAKIFLSENFSTGFNVTNLNSASMTLSNDRLPQTFTAGVAYESEELNVGVEYFKEVGFPSAVRIAAEFSPAKSVTFRAGSASGTNSFNAGVSLRFLSFELDYGAAFHQVLGMTHSFGISFRLPGQENSEYENIAEYRRALRGK